jgi:hypothetical protein
VRKTGLGEHLRLKPHDTPLPELGKIAVDDAIFRKPVL